MDKKQKIKTAAESGTKTPEAPQGMEAPEVATPSETAEATEATKAPEASSSLPADYLSEGYYKGEGQKRYPAPTLVEQAEEIGKALAGGGVSATAFNRMLRTLKAAKKLPFDAQQGALKKLMPQVLDLERKKKAPPLLRELVERNRAAVKSSEDYAACLDHFQDIAVFLTAAQTEKK